jgi:hypothetical protein
MSSEDEEAAPILDYRAPGPSETSWKTVWRAADPLEANLAVGKLQESGLHARVDFENTADLGVWAYAPGGTAVQVIEVEIPAARQILEGIERRRTERLNAQSIECPRCHARGARRTLHPLRKLALAIIVIGYASALLLRAPYVPTFGFHWLIVFVGIVLLFVPRMPRWRCTACGNRWSAPQPPIPEDIDEVHDD